MGYNVDLTSWNFFKEVLNDMKRVFITALCALALAAALIQAPASAAPAEKVERKDLLARAQDMFDHRFTPVIKDVKIGAAVAGKPIDVTVTVAYDDKRAKDKVTDVRVYFSTDNGKKWMRPAKLKKSGSVWKGQIPKQKKGKLLAYVWVLDSRGNVAVELPCKVATWPPASDGCMVKAAADPDPSDDKTSVFSNDLDIWSIQVGMDDTYLYIQQTVEGSINKGTMNPPKINSYLALLLAPSLAKEIDDLTTLMNMDPKTAEKKFKGKENMVKVMFWAPQAKSFFNVKQDCFVPGQPKPGAEQPMPEMKIDVIACKNKGPDLFFRYKKSDMDKSMNKEVQVLGGLIMQATSTDPKTFMQGLNLGDITNFTRVTWNPRTITVK
jgi:hypothetical protein